MSHVVVLGAGMVARPLVRYLLDHDHKVTVASRTVSKAVKLIDGHANGTALPLNVTDEAELDRLVAESDVTVSLVPYAFHTAVAERCIAHAKHMVTTSYVSPEMKALDNKATAAGVTLLNEIGVDPGIDHMSAMRIIDDVRTRGGKIVAFKSYCGGLPAPADNDNPFGYKFSWAPRGVLLASRNGASYLENDRKVEVAPERLFRDMHILQVPGTGDFEAYPNRDSISYIDAYGLAGISTMYRGTLRNMGWCDTMYCMRSLGLLEIDERDLGGKTYGEMMAEILGVDRGADLAQAAADKAGVPRHSQPIVSMEWLGLFSDRGIEGDNKKSPLDAVGDVMLERLAYAKGERDMIVLVHHFFASFPDGKREHITSSLVDFGIKGGDSSMARTVSLPAAIAVHLITQGTITSTGVLQPVTPEIYNPVLDELVTLDIQCKEETRQY